MPITNDVLLNFCNETVRTTADRLAGLLPVPVAVINAAVGQGIAALLGTTDAVLFRAEPWTNTEYAAVELQTITNSNSGGRTTLTNHHVIGILRALAAVKAMVDANPALGPLVAAVAVNPRA